MASTALEIGLAQLRKAEVKIDLLYQRYKDELEQGGAFYDLTSKKEALDEVRDILWDLRGEAEEEWKGRG